MTILDQAVLLAGFHLAHSANNLSYVDEVKVLTPTSIDIRDGKYHVNLHSGKTQAEAVAKAKQELTINRADYDSWAFAREGTLEEDAEVASTLGVSAWARGMEDQVVIVQRFVRKPQLQLVGVPMVALGSLLLAPEAEQPILELLRRGVSLHPDGGPKWESWKSQ